MVKQADPQAQRQLHAIDADLPSTLTLSTGRRVRVGWIRPCTHDKLDALHLHYFGTKQGAEPEAMNATTRRYFAKCCAAILLNSYLSIKLLWWAAWRYIYFLSGWSAGDYFAIVLEAKKKAQQQMYFLAMALLVEMTSVWTMMTQREAEEYRAELLSAKKPPS